MKISVLGCGWLGFPLAQHLLNQGHSIKGSTTSNDKISILSQADIEPYLLSLPDDIDSDKLNPFLESDILFLNIPPARGDKNVTESYPSLIKSIADKVAASSIKWVIFASSTSVYNSNGGFTEESDAKPGSAARPSGEAVLKAEEILQNNSSFTSTIIRFGGLYGYERHPVRYLAGKKNMKEPAKPINLIHQDDCIRIIEAIIKQDKQNEIYNAVSDGHPPRQEFYRASAIHFGLEPPEFDDGPTASDRVVSNRKLKEELDYRFRYPNPLDHTA